MSDMTTAEFSTYTWRPSQAENTLAMQRRIARAKSARLRKDLEDYPGESEDVYNRLLAEAIAFGSV